ncbi:MAG TPA: hypothetical protein VJB82_00075 [Candidatus Peribacterales bacterium]|nr:hypothetical protein [Candidatus Peribacterales bacterium]
MRFTLTSIAFAIVFGFSAGLLVQEAMAPSAAASQIDVGLDLIIDNVDVPTSDKDVREAVVDAIVYVLSFLALIAVVTIIIAGLVLMFGAGSENSVARAKKIILYTIIGLAVIFFARVIVGFFTHELPAIF